MGKYDEANGKLAHSWRKESQYEKKGCSIRIGSISLIGSISAQLELEVSKKKELEVSVFF